MTPVKGNLFQKFERHLSHFASSPVSQHRNSRNTFYSPVGGINYRSAFQLHQPLSEADGWSTESENRRRSYLKPRRAPLVLPPAQLCSALLLFSLIFCTLNGSRVSFSEAHLAVILKWRVFRVQFGFLKQAWLRRKLEVTSGSGRSFSEREQLLLIPLFFRGRWQTAFQTWCF